MVFALLIIVVYSICMLAIALYCLHQLHLAIRYIKDKKLEKTNPDTTIYDGTFVPYVTVQLPAFNEMYVMERLIDCICKLDYPQDKLQIQVLDDSIDESIEISRKKVEEYQAKGLDISLVRRPDRKGYKAGALQYGMEHGLKGEFIAIFDADFLPHPDFLKRTIPYFQDKEICAVQTRWEHLNKEYSLLTRTLAFMLDTHFSVEQRGRNSSGFFINFNGTAGVWRKAAIDSVGGWHSDTLAEDLDLSYRVQLNGWKLKYLENVDAPAELPAEISAVKSQQFRWQKGGAEAARKLLGKLWKSDYPLINKIHGSFHLLGSSQFVPVLLTGLLSVPLLYFKSKYPILEWFFNFAVIGILGFIAVLVVYFVSQHRQYKTFSEKASNLTVMFPVFMALSMGLSLHNAEAVIEGWLGKKSAFIRTPKFAITNAGQSFEANKYFIPKLSILNFMELFMALFFLMAMGMGVYLNDYGLFPFHAMFFMGYFTVFVYTLKHNK
jgi:cellulose synthase/poly-beta-1,6-N-acetylglucosamine synthase-like glycosyltransferase